jgi:hypothetical protein
MQTAVDFITFSRNKKSDALLAHHQRAHFFSLPRSLARSQDLQTIALWFQAMMCDSWRFESAVHWETLLLTRTVVHGQK